MATYRCALAGDGEHDCTDPTSEASCRPAAVSPLDDRRQAGEQVPIIVSAVEIIDGVEVPIGEPRVRTISRGALDLLHGNVSPLGDRRQRAREAFHDAPALDLLGALDEAIETATRVQITPEAVAKAYPSAVTDRDRKLCAPLLAEALTELGFEVEA